MTVLVLSACGGDSDSGTNPDPTPASKTVTASSNSDLFSPSDIKIDVGESVTWSFGTRQHTVVFASTTGAPANIGATSNAQVSRTFPLAGSFPYGCTIHPGMSGRVLVGSTDSESPPGY